MKNRLLGSAAVHPASHFRFWLTTGLALLADLLSKYAVWQWLEDTAEGSHPLIPGVLGIELAQNPGIAFGVKLPWPVIISAVIIGILLVVYLFLTSSKSAIWTHLGLGLILSGALGNLVDRLTPPWTVRDFIKFTFWPTFNLADAFLCVGVGIIALCLLRTPPRSHLPNKP